MLKNIGMKNFFVPAIITALMSVNTSLTFAGMPAPRCDEVLDSSFYYSTYIDTEEFRQTHPTFDQWELTSSPLEGVDDCINEGEKNVYVWRFKLPAELSTYALNYSYAVYLVVNWDKTASFPNDKTPEAIIAVAESTPEFKEFLEKQNGRVTASVDAPQYSPNGGGVSPLQAMYDSIDSRESLGIY